MEYKIGIITNESQYKLYHTITNSIKVHATTLKNIKTFILVLKRLQSIAAIEHYNDLELILEFNGYLNIAILDIATITRQLILTNIESEKSFYIKHSYSLIFETIKTYNKHGSKIKMLISRHSSALNEEYAEISNDIRKFKKDHDIKHIETVRNTVAAHVGELDKYFEIIDSLDVVVSLNATVAFIGLLTRLINLSSKLITVYNDLGQNPLDGLNLA